MHYVSKNDTHRPFEVSLTFHQQRAEKHRLEAENLQRGGLEVLTGQLAQPP